MSTSKNPEAENDSGFIALARKLIFSGTAATESHDFPAALRDALPAAQKATGLAFPSDKDVHAHISAAQSNGLDVLESSWYFGFGSNLRSTVFEERRGVNPLQIANVVLKGYRLAMTQPGFPVLEPSFANIEKAEDCPYHEKGETGECLHCVVHGVAYRITSSQLHRLHMSEGGAKNYDMIEVELEPYVGTSHDAGGLKLTNLRGLTLTVPEGRRMPKDEEALYPPSLRYMSILRAGARERGLREAWIAKLDQMPHSPEASLASRVGITLLASPMGLGVVLLRVICYPWRSRDWYMTMHVAAVNNFRWFVWQSSKLLPDSIVGKKA